MWRHDRQILLMWEKGKRAGRNVDGYTPAGEKKKRKKKKQQSDLPAEPT